MFSKILVANRGEIAVRIIRALKEMGVQSVAVYSSADREALHVELADEAVCIGAGPVTDSYLNMQSILSAAVCMKVDAIHPGYGLLSENAQFAELCEKCGISFIGPGAETIRAVGDKEGARRAMSAAGIPIIPGTAVIDDADEARSEAEKLGFPLVIKARSGGGGRGIRIVTDSGEFQTAFETARSEAEASFGDGGCYLEKYIDGAKHIEVQLIADEHGHTVCLGERDCSVQRRRQKIIEESPGPTVTPELRAALTASAVKAAKVSAYSGVGTVEFLVLPGGAFFFMEINARLQVEHPVTETVTGIDLVKWQIRVAAGAELPFSQESVRFDGHAIECRVNAEDPARNFLPSVGRIDELHVPGGPWVRFDSAIYSGYDIPPFYDSMIGKLIVHASTREEAIRKMRAALCELVIVGVSHNIDFLMEILASPEFIEGSFQTNTLEKGGF